MVDPKYPGGDTPSRARRTRRCRRGTPPGVSLFSSTPTRTTRDQHRRVLGRLQRPGATTALLTMTRGERGEAIPPALRHLEVGQPGCPDTDGTARAVPDRRATPPRPPWVSTDGSTRRAPAWTPLWASPTARGEMWTPA
ncbi:hypothetical protein QJS66_22075 [Kocuria rhizophila]|nr:hypothetical protein QJS66_22075 [Kocuria rhizophila]